ncbi:MAG: AMP-binding protein [Deltaproteobacteria bacterium]|nr:AMP-binding protein [Deltaproteobacteria bacterium]
MFEGMVGWPAEVAARYAAKGYWQGIAIGDVFDQSVRRHAGREAVIDGPRRTNYQELGLLVDRLALHFAERGICGGRPVVFQLANSLECTAAYFACLKTGAIPIACLPAHRHSEIEHIARFTEAYAWLIPSEYRGFDFVAMADELRTILPAMREIIVAGGCCSRAMTLLSDLVADPIEERRARSSLGRLKPRSEFPAVFQLSGGSTGLPKVIPRTHNDYLYNSYLLSAKSGFDANGAALIAIPMMHNFPLAGAVQPGLLSGGKIVLAQGTEPEPVCDLIAGEHITWLCAVPAMVVNWLNAPSFRRSALSSLKSLAVGGARLNPEPARRVLEEIGPILTQVYGMAEGLCCTTRPNDPEEVIVETQGRPISEADEFKIIDDQSNEVAPGELGELITRGPYTIRGYYKAPEHNRIAFTPDGFYRTGDMVRLHPSGNFIVEGRNKDLINRGGEKISAEEIENLIITHPAVLNTAVVAMPDSVMGERACAYVVLRPGASLDFAQLYAFLEQKRIARFKLPERLELIEALPATAVGKISKKDLREDIKRKLQQQRRHPL